MAPNRFTSLIYTNSLLILQVVLELVIVLVVVMVVPVSVIYNVRIGQNL